MKTTTSNNVLIEDLAARLRVNDPCLQHVSLQRLPLASLSKSEVQTIVQALEYNQIVSSVDLWFPITTTHGNNEHENLEDSFDSLENSFDTLDTFDSNESDQHQQPCDDNDDSYSYLIDTLSRNTSIRHLTVSSAPDAAWTALFHGLAGQSNGQSIGKSQCSAVQTLELGDAAAFGRTDGTDDDDYNNNNTVWSMETCRAAANMLQVNTSVEQLTLRGFSLLPLQDNGSNDDSNDSDSNVNILASGFAKNNTLQMVELHQIAGLAGNSSKLLGMLNVPCVRIIDCDLSMPMPMSMPMHASSLSMPQPWTDLLCNNVKLQALRLIECNLSLEQIQDLSNGLGLDDGVGALSLLDLRGNVMTQAACEALGTSLVKNTSLVKLILQDCDLTNAGLAALTVGLARNQTLLKLNLRGNQLQGSAGCEALCNALSLSPTSEQSVSVSSKQSSSNSSSTCSASASALQALDLSENNLSNTGAAALGRLLSTNPALQELHVESCMITGTGIAALSRGLQNNGNNVNTNTNTNLRELNLCQNVVDFKAATAMADMLASNNSNNNNKVSSALTTLNLSGCSVSDESAACLAKALTRNETLRELVLSFNRIGNVGAKALADVLPAGRLSSLAMQFNLFDNQGLEHFRVGLAQNGSVHLKDLFCLNAHSYTDRTDKCMREIVHYLSLNRAGRRCLQEEQVVAAVWPRILQQADDHYGANAIFHLLQGQPDLVAW
jgi:Ran GTPase-activating protein (RanGAP) involved in mRNA processing and transport